MTYSLTNKRTKNDCNQTIRVQVIVQNSVPCFLSFARFVYLWRMFHSLCLRGENTDLCNAQSDCKGPYEPESCRPVSAIAVPIANCYHSE